ncbi:unnamed protein product [Rotaria sordida]|uniref:Mos1 transposase HTH domain-containing protein n=1 Tax=Rotaria sordida TaxID=392033 RepID=A0A815UYD5_9BILA|nr:unnamed protein product [Rotaria sordida]
MFDRLRGCLTFRKKLQSPLQNEISTKKNDEREEWNRPVEFFLSLIGYSIVLFYVQDLGNVWRYPYIVRTALNVEATTIHDELRTVFSDEAPSYRTIARWAQWFREGREEIED